MTENEPIWDDARVLAEQVIMLLRQAGGTVAAAESLTGGRVVAGLTTVPGASHAVRGGVVAYATDLKTALLGVPRAMLDKHGAVYPGVATAMADGVRQRRGATFGVATTGVAGMPKNHGWHTVTEPETIPEQDFQVKGELGSEAPPAMATA